MTTTIHDPALNVSNEVLQRELQDMKRQLEERTRQLEEAERKLQEREAEQKPKAEGDEKSGFQGFVPPVSNWFALPNNWTDICAELSHAEIVVLQYILRHTWGFHTDKRPLTVDEFLHGRLKADSVTRMDKGTGLKSDRSVKTALKQLIEKGYITRTSDNHDKARIKHSYAPRMLNPQESNSEKRGVKFTPQSGKNHPSMGQNLPPNQVNSTPRSEKETRKETRKKEGVSAESTSPSVKDVLSPLFPLSQSSSQESPPPGEPKQEVEFTSEEESIYALAEKLHITHLKRDRKHKENCAKLLKEGVTTLEKLEDLMRFCRQKPHLTGKPLNLKNLINELNGWLQLQLPPDKQKFPAKITVGNMYLQPISSLPHL